MPPHAPSRAKRSDAIANRERLLAAAADAVRTSGEKVPMADIAERAGVGVGTLYRHFPTRERLFAGLVCRSLESVRERVRAAAGRPGPAIEAIDWFFDQTIAHRDELFLPLHGAPVVPDEQIAALQRQIRTELEAVLARGRGDGTIRPDVTATDIIIAGAGLAQPLAQVAQWDRTARRQARILLAGLRAADDAWLPDGPVRSRRAS